MPAEEVLGGSRSKAITGKRVASAQQLEVLVLNHDVEKSSHPAYRAIADERRDWRLRHLRFEPHRTTMTAALHPHGRFVGTQENAGKKAARGSRAAFLLS
jgi:hypothetical protein